MSKAVSGHRSESTPASIICTLLGAVILIAVALACAGLVVPGILGYQSYIVLTESMEPTIPAGSVVFVTDADPESLTVGDVVTFYQNGAELPVSHRIVEIDQEDRLIYTKGDANAEIDFIPTSFDNIVGIVRFSVPQLGKILQPLSSFNGKIAVAAAIVAGACLLELGGRLKKVCGEEDKNA